MTSRMTRGSAEPLLPSWLLTPRANGTCARSFSTCAVICESLISVVTLPGPELSPDNVSIGRWSITPLPAASASFAMVEVYGTSGNTDIVNGTPSATKPRSVSIHWPQSSTISASFAPEPCTRGTGPAGGAVTVSAGVADGSTLGLASALGSAEGSTFSVDVATGSGVSVAASAGASVSVGVDVTTATVFSREPR